jgi:hypothetical protein
MPPGTKLTLPFFRSDLQSRGRNSKAHHRASAQPLAMRMGHDAGKRATASCSWQPRNHMWHPALQSCKPAMCTQCLRVKHGDCAMHSTCA